MPRQRIAAYNGLFIVLALVISVHPSLAQDLPVCQTLELLPSPPQHQPKSPVDILQVEVPSTTASEKLIPYLGRLIASISRDLLLRLPESLASGEEGTVTIRVQLRKDGSLSKDGLSVVCTSGIKDMDAAAQSAIQNGAPFEPLPQTYRGPDVVLLFKIRYHLPGDPSRRYVPSNPLQRT
jgi:TonB family protein